MAYRVLLPSTKPITDAAVERALADLDVKRLRGAAPRWRVRDLAGDAEDIDSSTLVVQRVSRHQVQREDFDTYFFTPHGVLEWIEVRIERGTVDRAARLHARLVALTLCERLRLPAVETRNGVYCSTPQAFAAWCSREPHPETVLLASQEHLTAAPPRRLRVLRSSGPAEFTDAAPDEFGDAAPADATLPPEGWFTGWWHRVTNAEPYIVPLPATADPRVVYALIDEIAGTFRKHNVVHDVVNHRIIVYAPGGRGTQQAVNYFKRRAHPERLRAR